MTVTIEPNAPTESDVTVIPVAVPETDSAVVELAREAGEGNALLAVLIDRVASLEDRLESVETSVAIAIEMSAQATEVAVEAAEVAVEAAVEAEAASEPDMPSDGIEEPLENDTPPVRQHWLFRERNEWRH